MSEMASRTSLTVAGVARRLGIAPSTLRTWDRRYGLGPSEHCAGQHRKYTPTDLARLRYMHSLVVSGVATVDAATMALKYEGDFPDKSLDHISMPPALENESVMHLLRAAQVLDRTSVEAQIRSLVQEFGVASTWVHVLVPLLRTIGEDWQRTGESIAAEHMVSDLIKKVFMERINVEVPVNPVPVLLACINEETHSLAITALAATLADKNVQVQFLGARTPAHAINDVVRRCNPPAIFLWAQLPSHASVEAIQNLPAVRPAPRVILGGPGWSDDMIDGAFVVRDLVSACNEVMSALGH